MAENSSVVAMIRRCAGLPACHWIGRYGKSRVGEPKRVPLRHKADKASISCFRNLGIEREGRLLDAGRIETILDPGAAAPPDTGTSRIGQ